jgi:O-methyltransferase domain
VGQRASDRARVRLAVRHPLRPIGPAGWPTRNSHPRSLRPWMLGRPSLARRSLALSKAFRSASCSMSAAVRAVTPAPPSKGAPIPARRCWSGHRSIRRPARCCTNAVSVTGSRSSPVTCSPTRSPSYDVHLHSQVLHDWDADRVGHLLAALFAALPAGGWLLDHDTHINADKRGPLPVAEYSVLLMHSTPGKCWSTAALAEIASRVGFADVTDRPTAGDRSVLFARKPDRRA